MSISPLAMKAKQVIDAAWEHGPSYDLASQAAFALESAQLLQSPETAAEMEQLRRDIESNRVDGARLIRAEQRRAELEAVLDSHRKDDQAEIERLRTQVAELQAERHTTNESLSEAAEALREDRSRIAELERRPVKPWVPGPSVDGSVDKLTRLMAPTQALREQTDEEPPLVVFRASHDAIVMGHYTSREAAQAHCEAKVRQEEPAGTISHLSWSTEDIGLTAEYELHITPAATGELIRGTGYLVTPLEVDSAYDEEADE